MVSPDRDVLRLATEKCPIGAIVADEAGTILFVNPAFERQFGTREPIVGRLLSTLPVQMTCDVVRTAGGCYVVGWVDAADDRRELEEHLAFERLVTDLSASFVNIDSARVDEAIVDAQRRIVKALDLDRSTLFQWQDDRGDFVRTHTWSRAGDEAPQSLASARATFPWSFKTLARGENVVFSSLDQIPDATDREVFRRLGTRAGIALPLSVGGQIAGLIAFASLRETREWSETLLGRLQLIAQVFASALVRRRVDAALHASEERFRTLADHAPVMIWVSGSDKRCVWFNRQWLEFTGQSMEHELGDGWAEGVHPEDLDGCLSMYRRAFDDRLPFAMQYRLRRCDGAWRWLQDHGAPHYASDGTFTGYLGSCIDITEERESKERLEQALTDLETAHDGMQQAQHALIEQERLHVLGQMASGIAHDINNALGPVSLYATTIRRTEPSLSADAHEYLQIMERSVRDVAQTVDRLREFSRRRDAAFEPRLIDMNKVLDQVKTITRARWKDIPLQRGIVVDLQTECASDVPFILGDDAEIRGALVNVVFNAIDALPQGGTVTMRTRAAERAVHVEVTDSGVGMTDEIRRRCLEPFFTTKGDRGTGLGLAMVYGAMTRHSAQIEIDSTVGMGTTVRLTFPAAEALAPPPVQRREQPPRFSPLRVLVIDDDPHLRKSLEDVLTREGHTIRVASKGSDGIDAFRAALDTAAAFDAVLTDLAMPDADGHAVAAQIKQMSPATPVILLTGWFQQPISEEVAASIDHVLKKPPRVEELREVLATRSHTR